MNKKIPAIQREMAKALTKAIEKAGNGSELARALNITRQAISQWEIAPIDRVLEIEAITGVTRFELRPDYYSVPLSEKAEQRRLSEGPGPS